MNTQTDSITVAARNLQVGDAINGATVTDLNTVATPGVVYVWIDSGRDGALAHMVFNHGDPVRIVRPPSPAAVRAMFTGFGWTVTNP